jgi:hypothetical protein
MAVEGNNSKAGSFAGLPRFLGIKAGARDSFQPLDDGANHGGLSHAWISSQKQSHRLPGQIDQSAFANEINKKLGLSAMDRQLPSADYQLKPRSKKMGSEREEVLVGLTRRQSSIRMLS